MNKKVKKATNRHLVEEMNQHLHSRVSIQNTRHQPAYTCLKRDIKAGIDDEGKRIIFLRINELATKELGIKIDTDSERRSTNQRFATDLIAGETSTANPLQPVFFSTSLKNSFRNLYGNVIPVIKEDADSEVEDSGYPGSLGSSIDFNSSVSDVSPEQLCLEQGEPGGQNGALDSEEKRVAECRTDKALGFTQ